MTFQLSGLGPAQGQLNWFYHYHFDKTGVQADQTIFDRYTNECYRIYNVLETRLAAQQEKGSEWIALDRMTIADISFHSWSRIVRFAKLKLDAYPRVKAWTEKMEEMEEFKNAMAKMPL